jgi:hypothetical protein
LWPFWYIFPILVCCIKKNLATLDHLKKTKHYFCPGCAIYVHRYAVVSRVRNYGSWDRVRPEFGVVAFNY